MAKNFSELRAQLPQDAQEEARARAQGMIDAMGLQALRQARGLSQKALAERLDVQQPAVAKLEKRADMYLSTLRNHIEALGGKLEITARFPDGDVKILIFSDTP